MAGVEKQGRWSFGRKGLFSRKEGIVTESVPTAAEALSPGHAYLWVTPGSILCSDSRVPTWLKIFRIVQRRFDMEPRTSFCSDLHRFLYTKIQTISDKVEQTPGCPWGKHVGAGCRCLCTAVCGPARWPSSVSRPPRRLNPRPPRQLNPRPAQTAKPQASPDG